MKTILKIIIAFLILPISLYAQSWSELGTGSAALNAHGDIYTMCSDNHGNIYAAGLFPADSLGRTSTVYKWDGTLWTPLGHDSTALNPNCFCEVNAVFADTNGNVYATASLISSSFTFDGYYISKWDGVSWTQLGTGSGALY